MPGTTHRLALIIVDGFGVGDGGACDAISAASMPNWRALCAQHPHTTLGASGEAVGLPAGQMGNSEVGHLNIGSGQRVPQDLPRIDAAIADGSFAQMAGLRSALSAAQESGLHLITLLGGGGVHANDRHAIEVLRAAHEAGVPRILVHLHLDGRDTPPRSAAAALTSFQQRMSQAAPSAQIATIGGRYYGMDRDARWERTAAALEAIVLGGDRLANSPELALEEAYARGESDEFVLPTRVALRDAAAIRFAPSDVVIHANFRADRARQLIRALAAPELSELARPATLPVRCWGMTSYGEGEGLALVRPIFGPSVVPSLAGLVAAAGMRQLHVAETEKYAHVTYFLNGGIEEAFPGERRMLVPSDRVATYDLAPAMQAEAIAAAVVAALEDGEESFIVANIANPDMVGHTGDFAATVRACEATDRAIGAIAAAAAAAGVALMITGDHGNAEEMCAADGSPLTSHTLQRVPLLLAYGEGSGAALAEGDLRDIAPTACALLGLRPDPAMTGESLLRP
ncbi:MAG: 2,3-bisphosphoglycerate-independent phosphoglycerate mutase [Chloroflexi bacterium]|nr:2,3-bisphosphoglycerate-independent phosphoglycerate mutase [Chloroflexota bacterium]